MTEKVVSCAVSGAPAYSLCLRTRHSRYLGRYVGRDGYFSGFWEVCDGIAG